MKPTDSAATVAADGLQPLYGYVPSEAGYRTVKDLAEDDQPRERALRYGIKSLGDADLWAIILRTGTKGNPITNLCRDLMKVNDNLFLNLERRSREELMEIDGIGLLKAMQIEAVMEIVRRYNREKVADRTQILSPSTLFDIMRPEIGNLPHEEMWAVFLNRANRLIGRMRISQGGSTSTVFDIKKVVKGALMAHAEGVMLCHNHPSGNCLPSGADDAITRKFLEACNAIDLKFLDHLILTQNRYYSYHDSSTIL